MSEICEKEENGPAHARQAGCNAMLAFCACDVVRVVIMVANAEGSAL